MTAEATAVLDDYCLDAGDEVEVELLVPANGTPPAGILVEGRIVAATLDVLVLEPSSGGRRRTRIPWHAIALIRDAYTEPHPGLS